MDGERELLAALENDPERGMEEIVSRYTGLLWSVAARRLREPEDIRDCVNETFLELYARRGQLDLDKGSLKGYLSVITDRLAVRRYWQRCREGADIPEQADAPSPGVDAETRADLSRAMEQLSDEDSEIIRMKYYAGMTFREIARSMDLPYETVKKRHQRSLKKLLKAMTVGLLLAVLAGILAACAWLVLRYFGIVPGYGVNTDPTVGIYVLEKETVLETPEYTFTITDSWWNDGLLTAEYTLELPRQPDGPLNFMDLLELSPGLEGLNGGTLLTRSSTRVRDDREEGKLYFRGSLPGDAEGEVKLSLTGAQEPLELHLRRAQTEVTYEHMGSWALTREQGGLLAVPRLEEGRLLVTIYPLNEGEFLTDPGLTMLFGSQASVTVTGEDGRVLTGSPRNWHPFGGESCFDWDFGPADPGTYVLNVPYVYQSLAQYAPSRGEEEVRIPLSLRPGAQESTGADIPGGRLTFGPQRAEEPVGEQADLVWWTVPVTAQCTVPERVFANIHVLAAGPDCEVQMIGTQSMTGLRLGCSGGTEQVRLSVNPHDLYYRWEHEFVIRFTVE